MIRVINVLLPKPSSALFERRPTTDFARRPFEIASSSYRIPEPPPNLASHGAIQFLRPEKCEMFPVPNPTHKLPCRGHSTRKGRPLLLLGSLERCQFAIECAPLSRRARKFARLPEMCLCLFRVLRIPFLSRFLHFSKYWKKLDIARAQSQSPSLPIRQN